MASFVSAAPATPTQQLDQHQIWKIVAFVRSLSGETGAPGATAGETAKDERRRGGER